jgi:competence protein ComGC
MIEILMIIIIISMWVLSVVAALQKVRISNERVIQNVVANNLAAQWIELLYNLDKLTGTTSLSFVNGERALKSNDSYSGICLTGDKYLPCETWDPKFYRIISWDILDIDWVSMYRFCSIVQYIPVSSRDFSTVELCALFHNF